MPYSVQLEISRPASSESDGKFKGEYRLSSNQLTLKIVGIFEESSNRYLLKNQNCNQNCIVLCCVVFHNSHPQIPASQLLRLQGPLQTPACCSRHIQEQLFCFSMLPISDCTWKNFLFSRFFCSPQQPIFVSNLG